MYLLMQFIQWIKDKWHSFRNWTDRKILIPMWRKTMCYCSNRLKDRIEGTGQLPEWKQTVLEDFRFWLDDMPETPPLKEAEDGEGEPVIDLYTLLTEFASLRQEIKFQNREQNKSMQTLSSFIDSYRQTMDIFEKRTRELAELEEKIHKKAALPFLDLRDTLLRGMNASRDIAESGTFLRPVPKGIDGIVTGYEMTLKKYDKALARLNIQPIETMGRPFDPKTMKAVGKEAVSGREKDEVIEERMCGFIRDKEVIRTAEVVVNE